MTDRDPKPENVPAVSRTTTEPMPADELEARLALERLAAEHSPSTARRPPRGRR